MKKKLIIILVLSLELIIAQLSGEISKTVHTVTLQEAEKLIHENKDNPNFIILDVRTTLEYNTGHIVNAININYFSFQFQHNIKPLKKTDIYLIYCHSGVRSAGASKKMAALGFTKIYDFAPGIKAWKKGNKPLVK